MKKVYIIILSVIIFIGTILYVIYSNRHPLCIPQKDITSEIETGDLVFSVGESIKSDIVRWCGNNPDCEYSHVGIIVKSSDGFKIVHMSSDLGYIASQALDDFIKTADSSQLGFYRFRKQINKRHIEDVVDSLLQLNKQFDDDFDIVDDEKYYCTEFIYKILRDIKSDIYNDIKYDYHILPDDMANSALVYKITEIK